MPVPTTHPLLVRAVTRRPAVRLLLALVSCVLLAPLWAAPAQAALPDEQQWLSDVDTAMHGSKVYLQRQVDAGGTGLAVNLDIDNTALASHYDYGQPVGRVQRFAAFARSRGVALLFNTGRVKGDGRLLRAVRQLRDAGYDVQEICGRTGSAETLTHSKQRCRQHFADEGYRTVANVGNRSTDFAGGDYGRGFRLPSYGNQLA